MSHHGSFGWVPKFIGLEHDSFCNCSAPRITGHPLSLRQAQDMLRPCGVAVTARTGHAFFCGGFYCMTNWPDAFKLARRFLLRLQPPPRPVDKSANQVSFSWHIRVGDDILTQDAYLLRLFDHIGTLVRQVNKTALHIVVSQDRLCSNIETNVRLFCKFQAVIEASGGVFVFKVREQEALQVSMRHDVLVNTGSSFSMMAAELSPSQIVLMMPRRLLEGRDRT